MIIGSWSRALAFVACSLVVAGSASGWAPTRPTAGQMPRVLLSVSIDTVEDLFPGLQVASAIRVRNTTGATVVVDRVEVIPASFAVGCAPTMLRIEPVRVRPWIEPGETTSIPIVVELDRAAPDACASAHFVMRAVVFAEAP